MSQTIFIPQNPAVGTYIALLNQTGTEDPTAKVIFNSSGKTITWTRAGTGVYVGVLDKECEIDKTTIIMANPPNGNVMFPAMANTTHLQIVSLKIGIATDGLVNTTIEIKFYNLKTVNNV